MCVIIIKPPNVNLPKEEYLMAAIQANSDGFGLATHESNFKTLDKELFLSRLKTIPNRELCLIHLRKATCGSVSIKNCHPFEDNGVVFMHNGKFEINVDCDMTDSEAFLHNELSPYIRRNKEINLQAFLCQHTSPNVNKVAVFMNRRLYIFGEYWRLPMDECWYSSINFLRVQPINYKDVSLAYSNIFN